MIINLKDSQVWGRIRKIVAKDPLKYKYFIGAAAEVSQLGKEMGHRKQGFISVEGDEVLGYFSYIHDRGTDTLSDFELIRFKTSSVLIKDFMDFVNHLCTCNHYRRIEVKIIKGSPSYSIMEKIARRYDFKKVGTLTQAVRLTDKELHDIDIFEKLMEVKAWEE